MQLEELASGTIEKYLRDIRGFASWLGSDPLGKETVAGWKAHLLSLGLCPETINSKLSALNKFLKFLERAECCVKYLRIQRKLFRQTERELSKAEYIRLLETANDMGKIRLALLMETIWATGIRVSEVKYSSARSYHSIANFETQALSLNFLHSKTGRTSIEICPVYFLRPAPHSAASAQGFFYCSGPFSGGLFSPLKRFANFVMKRDCILLICLRRDSNFFIRKAQK